jgi:hypothetical protein
MEKHLKLATIASHRYPGDENGTSYATDPEDDAEHEKRWPTVALLMAHKGASVQTIESALGLLGVIRVVGRADQADIAKLTESETETLRAIAARILLRKKTIENPTEWRCCAYCGYF